MTTLRLVLYVAGLTVVTLAMVAVQTRTSAGLNLLAPTPGLSSLGTSEYSVVEWLQVLALVMAASLCAVVARLNPRQRALAIVLLGAALIALCRELDFFLDTMLFDHAWQILVAFVSALAIAHSFRYRKVLGRTWRQAMAGHGLPLIVLGVAVLLVFAPLLGSEVLWVSLLGEHYQRIAKIAAEELTELVGYWLWMCGQIEYLIASLDQRRLDQGRERRRNERRR